MSVPVSVQAVQLQPAEALAGLCRLAARASGALRVIAAEIGPDLRARFLAVDGGAQIPAADLGRSGILARDWPLQPDLTPQPVAQFLLPSALFLAAAARSLAFLPCPVAHAPQSGLLFLFADGAQPLEGALARDLALAARPLFAAHQEVVQDTALERQFTNLFESVPSGIVIMHTDGQFGVVNARAAALLGCGSGRHDGADLAQAMAALRAGCDNKAALDLAYAGHLADPHFAAEIVWSFDQRHISVDTHPLHGDGVAGRIWIFTDVTAEVIRAEHLRRLAACDPLTGLPNRRHFHELSHKIATARETAGSNLALLMIDIDHFKQINDRYGHPTGDAVLKAVVARCSESLRSGDLLARFGGEEFVALLSVGDVREAMICAERLLRAVSAHPIEIGTLALPVSISIGVTMARDGITADAAWLDHLIAQADAALYEAKQNGRDCVRLAQVAA